MVQTLPTVHDRVWFRLTHCRGARVVTHPKDHLAIVAATSYVFAVMSKDYTRDTLGVPLVSSLVCVFA